MADSETFWLPRMYVPEYLFARCFPPLLWQYSGFAGTQCSHNVSMQTRRLPWFTAATSDMGSHPVRSDVRTDTKQQTVPWTGFGGANTARTLEELLGSQWKAEKVVSWPARVRRERLSTCHCIDYKEIRYLPCTKYGHSSSVWIHLFQLTSTCTISQLRPPFSSFKTDNQYLCKVHKELQLLLHRRQIVQISTMKQAQLAHLEYLMQMLL